MFRRSYRRASVLLLNPVVKAVSSGAAQTSQQCSPASISLNPAPALLTRTSIRLAVRQLRGGASSNCRTQLLNLRHDLLQQTAMFVSVSAASEYQAVVTKALGIIKSNEKHFAQDELDENLVGALLTILVPPVDLPLDIPEADEALRLQLVGRAINWVVSKAREVRGAPLPLALFATARCDGKLDDIIVDSVFDALCARVPLQATEFTQYHLAMIAWATSKYPDIPGTMRAAEIALISFQHNLSQSKPSVIDLLLILETLMCERSVKPERFSADVLASLEHTSFENIAQPIVLRFLKGFSLSVFGGQMPAPILTAIKALVPHFDANQALELLQLAIDHSHSRELVEISQEAYSIVEKAFVSNEGIDLDTSQPEEIRTRKLNFFAALAASAKTRTSEAIRKEMINMLQQALKEQKSGEESPGSVEQWSPDELNHLLQGVFNVIPMWKPAPPPKQPVEPEPKPKEVETVKPTIPCESDGLDEVDGEEPILNDQIESAPPSAEKPPPDELVTLAVSFAEKQLTVLESHRESGINAEHLLPFARCPAFVANFDERFFVVSSVAFPSWTAKEAAVFLLALAETNLPSARMWARDMAEESRNKLVDQELGDVALLAKAYGALHVRSDSFCDDVTRILSVFRNTASPQEAADILGAFANLDYRDSRPFNDMAVRVRQVVETATAKQVATLTWAFAHASVWHYKLYWKLADRMTLVYQEATNAELIQMLSSLHRVDVRHERMFELTLKELEQHRLPGLNLSETVFYLSAFSKLNVWNVDSFSAMAKKIISEQNQLDGELLGETLMSFARVGLEFRWVFEELTMRALALGPSASPGAIAAIITACATVRYKHVELFTVLGERTLQIRADCPSSIVGAVLVGFATIGLKDDKLFIEMIPRVRHLSYYGSPQDTANVLSAYTSVGLWHYKLFTRLAERAIAVRAECTVKQIAQVFAAFAKVEMKYEKLYSEFSPRLQTVIPTAMPNDLTSLVHSYAVLRVHDDVILGQIMNRAIDVAASFEPDEARVLVEAFHKLNALEPSKLAVCEVFKPYVEELKAREAVAAAKQENSAAEGETAERLQAPA